MSSGEANNNNNNNSAVNPGTVLASAVDEEIAIFRTMQETMQQYQTNSQLVQSQRTENEMVLEEFKLLMKNNNDDDNDTSATTTTAITTTTDKKKKRKTNVYKMIGPVLILQSIEDAYDTVNKRIQFITTEQTAIQSKITTQEALLQKQAQKVQQMQSALQQSTVHAVQSIAQQHN